MFKVKTFKKLAFFDNGVNQILCFLLAISFFSVPIYAQEYTVKKIEVFMRGKSANLAKTQAIEQGAKNAYLALMKKFNKVTNNKILKDVLDVVQSYQIVSEAVTDHSYRAVINYSFNLEQIQEISPIDLKLESQKIVLIPMVHFKEIMWPIRGNDSWYTAWQQQLERNMVPSLILPNIVDLALVRLNKLVVLIDNMDDFVELCSSLQGERLILALATVHYNIKLASYTVNVELKSFFKENNHFVWKKNVPAIMVEGNDLGLVMDQLVIQSLEVIEKSLLREVF